MTVQYGPVLQRAGSAARRGLGAISLPTRPAPGQAVRKVRRLGLGAPHPLGWVLGPALIALVWTLGSASGVIDARILTEPWTTVATAIDLIREGRLQDNLAISAWRAAQGLAFGVSAGVLVALLAGLSLFAIGSFRARVLPRWAGPLLPLAWLLGGPLATSAFRGATLILAAAFSVIALTLPDRES